MDIISPASLWKDFDRKELPLDVVRLYEREENGYLITALYYTALKIGGGFVRAFARFYKPLAACNSSVIVYFNDIHKSIFERSTLREALPDYAFLCVDYAGRADDRSRFTIYPKSLERLNYFDYPEAIYDIPDDVRFAGRYVWTAMAMRAVTLIENEFSDMKNIGIAGVGLGGCPAIMSCCFEPAFLCGVTIYSAGFIPEKGDKPIDFTAFKAALSCESYAPFIKSPLLSVVASNERDGSLDYMNDIYQAITFEPCRLSIVERTSRSVSVKQRKNCKFWFDYHINKVGIIPNDPIIKAKSSDGRLYIETAIDRSDIMETVELFVSQGMENPAFRNWSLHRLEKVDENDYIAKIPVFDIKSPLYAFVNVKYKGAGCYSSGQLIINPEKLGIKGEDARPTRLIYDNDMGLDDWTLLNDTGTDENVKLSMEVGPFDIAGVSSSTGNLTTFKISEKIYKSFAESSLQLLIYSPILQEVSFKVVLIGASGDAVEYSCSRKLSPADNWSSLAFSSRDFKSASGTLQSFEGVVALEINSKGGGVLVSSLIWV